MSPRNQAGKSANLPILNSLFTISESPLSHPPGYSASCSPNCSGSSSEGCHAGHPERNLESYLTGYSVSYPESYLEMNSASCRESSGESCSPSCSAICPENRSADSSESSLPDNSEGSWENCSESCRESLLLGAFPSSTSLDEDDLANNSRLVAGGLWPLPGLCLSLRLGGETERSPAAANRPGSPPPPRGAGLHPPCPTT